MTLSTAARPAPGTTDLLEVLDRALAGGIVIASERRTNVVALARASHRARIVVTATETYLQHPEPEPGSRPAAPVAVDRVGRNPKRTHG